MTAELANWNCVLNQVWNVGFYRIFIQQTTPTCTNSWFTQFIVFMCLLSMSKSNWCDICCMYVEMLHLSYSDVTSVLMCVQMLHLSYVFLWCYFSHVQMLHLSYVCSDVTALIYILWCYISHVYVTSVICMFRCYIHIDIWTRLVCACVVYQPVLECLQVQ